MATNQFLQKCRYCGNDVQPKKGILVSVWDGVDGLAYETACKKCILARKNAAQQSVQSDVMPCGHPQSAVVQADGGTAYCGLCEESA